MHVKPFSTLILDCGEERNFDSDRTWNNQGEDDTDEAFEEESPDDNQLVFLSHHEDYYTHWAEEFFNDFRSADRVVIDDVLFHASVTNNYAKVSPTLTTSND